MAGTTLLALIDDIASVLDDVALLTKVAAKRPWRVPADVVLHYADVPQEERTWFGAVPTTSPRRSLSDCAREGFSPELLRQAAQQALRRGLVAKAELGDVEEALKPFGGLAA